MNVYIYKSLSPETVRHGGVRRSQQVVEDIVAMGYEAKVISVSAETISLQLLLKGILWAVKCMPRNPSPGLFVRTVFRAGQVVRWLEREHPRVLLVEHTSCPFIFAVARAYGVKKIISIPHNLEVLNSTSRHVFGLGSATSRLGREIDWLKRSDLCLAISEEEAWLLRLHGVNCTWFPYNCDKSASEISREIRENRAQKPTDRLLVMGSNQSVHQSAQNDLINYLETERIATWVCGFGQLKEDRAKEGRFVEMLGAIDDKRFISVMSDCRAVLVHQLTGSGALTRIVEAIAAGVPVICSRHAARSTNGLRGIIAYDSLQDIKHAIEKIDGIHDVGLSRERLAAVEIARYALNKAIRE